MYLRKIKANLGKSKPLWMNNEAADAVKAKIKSYNLFMKHMTYSYATYARVRNESNRVIKQAKIHYQHKLATECKNNSMCLEICQQKNMVSAL